MALYDAFISYSHARDKPIAAALQSVVQRLGKPWYQLRALRIFRDDTSLTATPHLWPSIEQALNQSRFLILFASPEAASSPWVNKEVAHWLEHNSIDTLLIALTDGELAWDDAAVDFIWSDATPLPPALEGQFTTEPKWVDLRVYRDGPRPRQHAFMDLGADFAAAIHGLPKEDLLSEEVRQQRRALTLAWSAVGALLVLAGLAGWQWKVAVDAERVAVEQRKEAQAQRDRAEQTLAAATQNANRLVLDVAVKIRQTIGVPVELARDILARARELQDELAKHNAADPALRRSQAVALRESSQTRLLQGDSQVALDEALQSRVIMEQLLAADPGSPALRRELSFSLNRIGEALSQLDRHEEALAAFGESLAIRKDLAAATGDLEPQRELALSHERTADEFSELGRREEAAEHYRASLAIRERLSLAEPDKPERQADLAVSYSRLGGALADRPEEALAIYRKSLAIWEKLAAADPRNADWQHALAAGYDDIGNVLLNSEKRAVAIAYYRTSLEIRERLAAGNLDIPRWQANIAISLLNLARADDQPKENLAHAREIVRKLDHDGKLDPKLRGLADEIEQRLAELP